MIVDGHAQPMRFAVSRHGGRVSGVTVFFDGESFVFGVPDSVGDAAMEGPAMMCARPCRASSSRCVFPWAMLCARGMRLPCWKR
jgi:hypothetical protein